MGIAYAGSMAATVMSLAMSFGHQPEPTSPALINTVMVESSAGILCSGALISETAVITAAHCYDYESTYKIYFDTGLTGEDSTRTVVSVGVTERRLQEDREQSRRKKIAQVEGHDLTAFPFKSANDDLAIFHFQNGIPASAPGRPPFRALPLLSQRFALKEGAELLVAGYGINGANQTGELNEGLFQFQGLTDIESKRVYLRLRPAGAARICGGDSGGPAYFYGDPEATGENQWYIAGVTSGYVNASHNGAVSEGFSASPSGPGCGDGEFYSASVAEYLAWIEHEVVSPGPTPVFPSTQRDALLNLKQEL